MRRFIREELSQYDGHNGLTCATCEGKVYDVSQNFLWRRGTHQFRHHARRDLAEALKQVPHRPQMLERFPAVGELIEQEL